MIETSAWIRASKSSAGSPPAISLPTSLSRSAPAQKCPPVPVRIATRTSSSPSIVSQASARRTMTSGLTALRASGRLKVTVAMCPSTSYRTAGPIYASASLRPIYAFASLRPIYASASLRRGTRFTSCFGPRHVGVFFALPRQAEHPFGDHVAQDLGRAAADRECRREQEATRPPHRVGPHRSAVEQHAVGPRQVFRQDERLLSVRVREGLAERSFGSRSAGNRSRDHA